jgi:hypothetical protein
MRVVNAQGWCKLRLFSSCIVGAQLAEKPAKSILIAGNIPAFVTRFSQMPRRSFAAFGTTQGS